MSGTCLEHVWCVPEKAQPVEKSVIAFFNKLTRFFQYVPYMAHHALKGLIIVKKTAASRRKVVVRSTTSLQFLLSRFLPKLFIRLDI